MKLPHGAQAIVDERKLLDYVLNLDHPVGGHHALLFRDLLGITQSNWAVLRDTLLDAARNEDVVAGQPSPYGQKYEMRIPMSGRHGVKTMLAVWLVESGGVSPRLITCYVE